VDGEHGPHALPPRAAGGNERVDGQRGQRCGEQGALQWCYGEIGNQGILPTSA